MFKIILNAKELLRKIEEKVFQTITSCAV